METRELKVQVHDPKHAILTIAGVFSEPECARLIEETEAIGYADAPITTSHGFVMAKDIRDNTRVMLDDPARANALYETLAHLLPPEWAGARLVGLNERLRFYRYTRHQQFVWHRDGAFVRDGHERSHLTLLVYLNDDFEGGETEIDIGRATISIAPVRGSVLVFEHRLRHQGATVLRGRKYVLRSDVMYRWT